MFVPFDSLPDAARLWVYQADRALTAAEQQQAAADLRVFCEQWAAHGHPLRTSFALVDDRFVLLAVDEGAGLPSGCSIDSSVGVLRALEAKLGASLLDKGRVAFRRADATVEAVALPQIRQVVTDGGLLPDTLIFDTLVPTVGAFRTEWLKPADKTWLRRYFS